MENILKKVIILSGKAGSGKDFVADKIIKYFLNNNKKCIKVSYAYYIKDYLKRMNKFDESNKENYRKLMQDFGINYLKEYMGDKFLINRVMDDIKVFSKFYDYIIITDARLISEIEEPNKYYSCITIRITRDSSIIETELKEHITEVSLDAYSDFDYVIKNDVSIDEKLENILKGV